MKINFFYTLFMPFLFLLPNILFGQAPDLGTSANFAVFTATGAFSNDGATQVTGDVGTHVGAFTGFPPGVVNGQIHVANPTSAQAASDVENAYLDLNAVSCEITLGVSLGNNQTITPNTYCIGAASTLNGVLILDGQCDPDALFIIKIDGALATGVGSQVVLTNSASLCNVYWQINGAVTLGENSFFRGTILANGAISLLENATLFGRGLSRAGAIDLHNNLVDYNMQPSASIVTAAGPTTFCEGGSVVLSGNCGGTWSSGDTTETIVATANGNYFVTTNNACGSAVSNNILVTVIQPPVCIITGDDFFCVGGSTQLCAPAGADTYLWSTGESTNCIIVTAAGTYSATVTDVDGCFSDCEISVTENPSLTCTITGNDSFCEGGSTQLCATPGAASYLWSTGESTNCISVSAAGNYSATVTDADGCISTCNVDVTQNPSFACTITGNDSFCEGGSTQLCATPGAISYLWSTGESTNCITVSTEGNYSATVTDADGCISTCNVDVTQNPSFACIITGNDFFCVGGSTQLCATPGATSYLWSTGESTNCITVSTVGNYSVTVTDADGCISVCQVLVSENTPSLCIITGNDSFCEGGSTELCTTVGAASYLWSNGDTTNCITVTLPGNYSVTVTDSEGCFSTCEMLVSENPPSICTIIGDDCICPGETSELCATPGAAAYLWSTGATTSCITISTAGTYSVTVSDADGCSSVCDKTVISVLAPVIACPIDLTVECDVSLLPSFTGTATAVNNCDLEPTITFLDATIPGACLNEFEIARTWTATNACGTSSTCIQTLTVIDTEAPVVTCPENLTLICADQVPPVDVSTVAFSDNCGGVVTITHSGDVITDEICVNNFTLTRSYLATDECGNTSACSQVITVSDIAPPAITFVNSALLSGDTLWVQCYGQDPNWDLPSFNEGSIVATDSCAGDITIDYNQYNLSQGACENGIINLFRFSWIVTDECGNTDSVYLSLAMIDTIAPVIYGVPDDITVNCDEIPPMPENLYATDECLCVCILAVEESELIPGCMNGQVLLRTWTAIDECGNTTTATQTITLVDETGPDFLILQPEIYGIADGTVLDYNCSDGGIPEFFGDLGPIFALGAGSCGKSFIMSFGVDTLLAPDCEVQGFQEIRAYTWVAIDECTNQSTMTIYARLIDDVAPVLTGVPDTACIDVPIDVNATDDCGTATIDFVDTDIPNPCGSGLAVQRIYRAYDECGNSSRDTTILIPNEQIFPNIEFTNPILAAISNGDTLVVSCEEQNGLYTSFGIEDVQVDAVCGGMELSFTEELLAQGDCNTNGIVATLELRWTATDLCGNSSELTVIANVMDETSPVFEDFLPIVSIGCNDDLPQLFASDNCGDVTFQTTWDSIIPGACVYEYEMQRMVTATDECSNTSTLLQTIFVGNDEGPTFNGITEVVCNDVTIPVVTAYDACAGEFTSVSMEADTLVSPCGMIIERTWTSTDSCGNTASSVQTVIVNDTIPPQFDIPVNSFIYRLWYNSPKEIFLSKANHILFLSQLDANSIAVTDNCDQPVNVEFTVDTLFADDCLEDGYLQYRTYTWTATDVCGNATTLSFSVYIVDDVPPVLEFGPGDLTVICDTLPIIIPPVFVEDASQPVTVVYSEATIATDVPGIYLVIRTWTATDACGNVAIYEQTIEWTPESLAECNIVLPPDVACNTHSVPICVENPDNLTGTTYYWEIVGDDCFIQSSPDSACILIYIGWSPVEITLTTTDEFGCVTTCVTTLYCEFTLGQSVYSGENLATEYSKAQLNTTGKLQQLRLFPNPSDGNLNISFETDIESEVEFHFMSLLGEPIQKDVMTSSTGLNTTSLDVSHVPDGSYLMQIRTATEVHTSVVVIMQNR